MSNRNQKNEILSTSKRKFRLPDSPLFIAIKKKGGQKERGQIFIFKSLLVDEDEYLLPLSRYIHLNPIRTSRFKNADVQTKCMYLKTYHWSTFPGYCYLRKRNQNIGYDYSTVSRSRARLKAKLKSSCKLKEQFHRILEQIENLSK
jgi:hypothetical protein